MTNALTFRLLAALQLHPNYIIITTPRPFFSWLPSWRWNLGDKDHSLNDFIQAHAYV